jgi:hypothetical protein
MKTFSTVYISCRTGLPNKKFGMRFQVLMAVSMKMTAFWDIMPCNLAEVDQCFRGSYCLHHLGNMDGGSMHLWIISLLRDYMV